MGALKHIASGFYRVGVVFRNWLYDAKILRSHHFSIPIVCVGNIAVGGTGKTPTVEYLISRLGSEYSVAVLSRGYGRHTKGYREVEVGDSFLAVGDEPKQIKRKFPDIPVIVCENRCKGVVRIQAEHPEVTLIIMDDGFQHRSLVPRVSIILSDYSLPPDQNKMLPAGTLRDTPSQLYRANILLITKTPQNISPIERNIAQKALKPFPYQTIFFTDVRQGNPKPIFSDLATDSVVGGSKVIALAGIANPKPFLNSLKSRYNVVDEIIFPDHHTYRIRDIKHIANCVARHGDKTVVITTEKDGVKLTSRRHIPDVLQNRLYVLPIGLNFRDGDESVFLDKLITELKNQPL